MKKLVIVTITVVSIIFCLQPLANAGEGYSQQNSKVMPVSYDAAFEAAWGGKQGRADLAAYENALQSGDYRTADGLIGNAAQRQLDAGAFESEYAQQFAVGWAGRGKELGDYEDAFINKKDTLASVNATLGATKRLIDAGLASAYEIEFYNYWGNNPEGLLAYLGGFEKTQKVEEGFETTGQGTWLNHDFGPEFGMDYDATDQKHSGSQSLKLWATQTTNDPNKWEMSGTKQIISVEPGDLIGGGAWLKWQDLNKIEAYVEVKWLDVNKQEFTSVPAGYALGIGTPHKTSGSGDWEYQDLDTWTTQERTAPPDAAYAEIRLVLLAAGTADVATGIVWWDDAQFTVIPGKSL